jgi:hypothetical protein
MGENKNPLARIPAVLPFLILIAATYVGWTFYSRWSYERDAKKSAETQELERARKDVELNGGISLKILSLSGSTGLITKGQSAQLCYGVANAKNVRFEPVIDNVWPSLSRCVDVSPNTTTTYTLTADDGAGHSQTAHVTIQVR